MLTTAFIIIHVNTTVAVSDIQLIGQVGGFEYSYETILECADAIERSLKLEGTFEDYQRNAQGQFIAYTEPSSLGGFRSYACVRVKLPNDMTIKP